MSNSVEVSLNRRMRMSDADVTKASKVGFSNLAEGAWYRGRITSGVKIRVNKVSGNMAVSLPVAPLDGSTPRRPTVYHNVTLPWLTPADLLEAEGLPADLQMTGKKPGAPNTAFLVAGLLRAIFGAEAFPETPRYDKSVKGYVFGGETITKAEAETISADLTTARDSLFSDLMVNPDAAYGTEIVVEDEDGAETSIQTGLVGLEFWFKNKNNEASDGRIFSNVDEIAYEPPADAVLGGFDND